MHQPYLLAMKESKLQSAPAIIVMGGAFSPVHCGHLAAMEAAQAFAQEHLQVRVVAGYLACATNGYTSHKYGTSAIRGQARLDMCNLAVREHLFLRETPQMYGSARQCGEAMVKANHNTATRIIIVCGADKAGKKRRGDHIYMSRASVPAMDLVPSPQSTAHMSATLVRDIMAKAASMERAAQQLVKDGMVPHIVADYMVANAAAFAGVVPGRVQNKSQPQPAVSRQSRWKRPESKHGVGDEAPQAPSASAKAVGSSEHFNDTTSKESIACEEGQDQQCQSMEVNGIMTSPRVISTGCWRKHNAHRSDRSSPLRIAFDMETGDPDDVLTLLLLCSFPSVELCAVTVTPGSSEQVALVRCLLQQVGLSEVRVGAQSWPDNADKAGCMQGKFYRNFGRIDRISVLDCEPAAKVLIECCDENTTLLTGGPLHNLGAALRFDSFRLGRWVAQGGFAGEGVVPRELQMDKFVGKVTCQTWNFNGNIEAATAALSSGAIGRRVLVSKNVCHRVVYDTMLHDAIDVAAREAVVNEQPQRATALGLIHNAMCEYQRSEGKKLHDPLAMAVALDESICDLAEVRLFRDRQGWGSRLEAGTNTWISVNYCDAGFRSTLLGQSVCR